MVAPCFTDERQRPSLALISFYVLPVRPLLTRPFPTHRGPVCPAALPGPGLVLTLSLVQLQHQLRPGRARLLQALQ